MEEYKYLYLLEKLKQSLEKETFMTPMELKKLQVEYKRVNAAREEQELRILELQEQIDRVQKSIDISKLKEEELTAKLNASENIN